MKSVVAMHVTNCDALFCFCSVVLFCQADLLLVVLDCFLRVNTVAIPHSYCEKWTRGSCAVFFFVCVFFSFFFQVLQGKKLECFKDSSNNLGLNSYFFSEPGTIPL